jgi:hypothetical protein
MFRQPAVGLGIQEAPAGQVERLLVAPDTLAALEEVAIVMPVAAEVVRLGTLATEGPVALLAVHLGRLGAQGLEAAAAVGAAGLFTL